MNLFGEQSRFNDKFTALEGTATGEVLIEVMQLSPHPDIELEPRRTPMPVRDVSL